MIGHGHDVGVAAHLVPMVTTGIGLLEDKDFHFLRAGATYVESTAQHDAFLSEPEPLMVTKANVKTRVHRRTHRLRRQRASK